MKRILTMGLLVCIGVLWINLAIGKVADFYLKTTDTLPYYTAQLLDSTGTAVDISSATITAKVENINTGAEIVDDGTCYITNGTSGYFEYRFADGETNTAGSYAIEFKILLATGQITLPSSYNALVIINDRY